jgi:acyl-CoA thioesterase YciA
MEPEVRHEGSRRDGRRSKANRMTQPVAIPISAKTEDATMDGSRDARDAVIRTIAMPSDTNPAGDIFGGWLMSQMDLAAGNAAARRARGRCATVAVDAMSFHSPVYVGDEVSVYADLISSGRTSMKFRVEAWRRSRDGDEQSKVTEAVFTFVALDSGSRPRPLPPAS